MAIIKGNIIMVFDGSNQPNMDENRGAETCRIQFTYIKRYTQVSIPTTSQVVNAYKS